MITNSEIRHIEMGGGFTNTARFTINASAKAFRHLFSKVYTDKPRAVLIEAAQNARDSHISVGLQDKPFEITLPTAFDPEFKIRDFGKSMTEEYVLGEYLSVFSSSKETSNEFNGAFGIGKLASLSVSDSYTLTTYLDGIENSFLIYLNEEGVPDISKLGEKETSEPNGVLIQVPVKQEFIHEFPSKAAEVFKHFKTKPIVTNFDITFNSNEYVFEGSGWGVRGKNHIPVVVSDIYELPIQKNLLGDLTEQQSALLECGIVLFVDIGKVNFSTSRESLDYCKKTIQNIKDALSMAVAELSDVVEDKLKTATLFEKIQISSDLFSYRGALSSIAKFTKTILSRDNIPNHYDFSGYSCTILSHRSARRYGGRSQVSEYTSTIVECNQNNQFFYGDNMAYYKHKARKIFEGNSYANIIVLKAGSSSEADFEAKFGVKMQDFPKFSELPFDKTTYTRKRRADNEYYVFQPEAYYAKEYWAKEVLDEETDILYINNSQTTTDYLRKQIKDKLAFINCHTGKSYRVVRLSDKEISKLDEDDFEEIGEVYTSAIEEIKQNHLDLLQAALALNYKYPNFPEDLLKKLKLKAGSLAEKALAEYKTLRAKISKKEVVINRIFNTSPPKFDENTCNHSTEKVLQSYPLLKLDYNHYNLTKEVIEDLSLYVEAKNV